MMTHSHSDLARQVKAFCAEIGADPLLVQGAGGNVSWKENGALWIKASGTWLADAQSKDIFVPVDLAHLRTAIDAQDFNVKPAVLGGSELRPSIETLLHALLPHRVVVHVHAIEVLAHLVQRHAQETLQRLVGEAVEWVFVDYFKPGADLARAVSEQVSQRPRAQVVFLGSHGVVIGADDTEQVASILGLLIERLQASPMALSTTAAPLPRATELLTQGYVPSSDEALNELARRADMAAILRNAWALYPDHVVFLGAAPAILEADFTPDDLAATAARKPAFIFAINDGVYEHSSATLAQRCQLRCYYDVVARLATAGELATLSERQVAELLNWDAEKYRQNVPVAKRT